MAITYEEVIENELLPEELLQYIIRECPFCGTELEFTDKLTQIYCPNKGCYSKIAARLESMAKAMGIDDWGESTCLAVCQKYNVKTPFQIFTLEKLPANKREVAGIPAFDKKIRAICDREKRKVQLWEMVKLASLPGIDTNARKIFGDYNTIEDAYKDIEKYQVPFIAKKLGLKKSDTGVMAVSIFNTLLDYRNELQYGEMMFEIYKPMGMKVMVAITGGVNGYKSKAEFIKELNARYLGMLNLVLMNSVTTETDILVHDGDNNSTKYRNALRINEKSREGKFQATEKGFKQLGEAILITDSESLVEKLDEYCIDL